MARNDKPGCLTSEPGVISDKNVKSGQISNNHVHSCFVTDPTCVLSRHPPTALVRHDILLLAHFGGPPRYRSLLFALHHRLFSLHLG